jgi:hypothetical protein
MIIIITMKQKTPHPNLGQPDDLATMICDEARVVCTALAALRCEHGESPREIGRLQDLSVQLSKFQLNQTCYFKYFVNAMIKDANSYCMLYLNGLPEWACPDISGRTSRCASMLMTAMRPARELRATRSTT